MFIIVFFGNKSGANVDGAVRRSARAIPTIGTVPTGPYETEYSEI